MAQSQKAKQQKAKDQANAATAEVNEETRTITVREKEFDIPTNQPAEILFSARAVSRATRTGDESAAVEAMMDMAIAYLGEEPLRDLMAGEDLEGGMAVVEEVLSAASESYGASLGE